MSPSTHREATSSSATPTTTPTSPVLRGSSNLPSYRQFGLIHCGQCRLPKEYSHTMWARGIVSGWTCHCDRTPYIPTHSPELPLAGPAKDAQRVHDAEQLLAREDTNAGSRPGV